MDSTAFAKSILNAESDLKAQIYLAYQRVFLRSPSDRELQRAAEFIEDYRLVLGSEDVPADDHLKLAWSS